MPEPPAPFFGAGPSRSAPLATWVDPIAALRAVRHARGAALLYSGLTSHPESRHSILAWDPLAEITLRQGTATILRHPTRGGGAGAVESVRYEDPFTLLRQLMPAVSGGAADPAGRFGGPFCGGAIGWLGYGLRRSLERLPAAAADPLDQPDAWFGIYDGAVLFDHRERRVTCVAAPAAAAGEEGGKPMDIRLAALRAALSAASAGERPATAPVPGRDPLPGALRVMVEGETPRTDYLARVRRVLDLIARGDLYQVNLSHRISCPLSRAPLDLFEELMRINPAPFAAYLEAAGLQTVCASPERLVRLRGREALSSPIKGTRRRGFTPQEDASLRRELGGSAKDRAENVMIVDLVRNDLGRVCAPGSVQVRTLCGLETFATVHHLVSTVEGRLREGLDRFDLLRALFPGGSMTGAPKIRAMEVIAALEGEERGIYSGSIGYLSRDGSCDFNVVIRTLVCARGRAHLRVGGGIVADSDPAEEFEETLDKARALLDVLGAELRTAD